MTGPEKVGKRISRLAIPQHDVIFIQYFFHREKNWFWKKLFGKRIGYDENLKVFTAGVFTLLKILFRFRPDIIHCTSFERFYLALFPFKKFLKAKILYTVNGIVKHESKNFLNVSRYYKIKEAICEKTYICKADMLFCLSEQALQVLKNEYKTLNIKKVRLIHNGVDEIFFTTSSTRHHSILKVVFPPLTDRKEKGLDIFKKIVEGVNFPLQVYLSDTIASAISFHNPNIEVITFHKMNTEELAKFWSDKDVVILPGIYETFSIAVAEAMVAGVIPIVSQNVGISRFIQNYHSGFVFPLNSISKVINFLEELSSSYELRQRLSFNAKTIYEQLKWEKVFEQYDFYYNQLSDAKDFHYNARL
ncbi:MAG: glycosyltransferase family 4 protein [Ignavibacteria bacterium]